MTYLSKVYLVYAYDADGDQTVCKAFATKAKANQFGADLKKYRKRYHPTYKYIAGLYGEEVKVE